MVHLSIREATEGMKVVEEAITGDLPACSAINGSYFDLAFCKSLADYIPDNHRYNWRTPGSVHSAVSARAWLRSVEALYSDGLLRFLPLGCRPLGFL